MLTGHQPRIRKSRAAAHGGDLPGRGTTRRDAPAAARGPGAAERKTEIIAPDLPMWRDNKGGVPGENLFHGRGPAKSPSEIR